MRQYDAELAFYSPPADTPNVKAIKEAGQQLAEEILKHTAQAPEQTIALRYVEESVLRAVDCLARESATKEIEKAGRNPAKPKAA
ncbi:MAG: hypothetical protein PSY14_06900 [bacterium]|nr:hypothetical protein [bacterium]